MLKGQAKGIIVANAAALAGSKRAMLAPFTTQDMCQIGTSWQGANGLPDGQAVQAVNHFGRHTTAVGDVVQVEDDEGKRHGRVRIESIELADSGDLTDADARDLGYSDRADFVRHEPGYSSRRVWLIRVMPQKRRLFGR